MTLDEWRERVGVRIERRREQLRLSKRAAADRAGFSEGQWRQMESGRRAIGEGHFVVVNPRPSTRGATCAVLLWTDDSIDRLVAGEDPIETDAPNPIQLALRSSVDSRALTQLRIDLEQLRQDHLALVDIVHRALVENGSLGSAADTGVGPPPHRRDRTYRPSPTPEG